MQTLSERICPAVGHAPTEVCHGCSNWVPPPDPLGRLPSVLQTQLDFPLPNPSPGLLLCGFPTTFSRRQKQVRLGMSCPLQTTCWTPEPRTSEVIGPLGR